MVQTLYLKQSCQFPVLSRYQLQKSFCRNSMDTVATDFSRQCSMESDSAYGSLTNLANVANNNIINSTLTVIGRSGSNISFNSLEREAMHAGGC